MVTTLSIPDELIGVVTTDPEVLGGTPCFSGTRVPLATFLDYIEEGYSLEAFLRGYSGVSRKQAGAVLHWFGNQSRKSVGLELAS